MTPALVGYVAAVAAAGGALLALSFGKFLELGWMHITAWIVVSLLAESLWIPTVSAQRI